MKTKEIHMYTCIFLVKRITFITNKSKNTRGQYKKEYIRNNFYEKNKMKPKRYYKKFYTKLPKERCSHTSTQGHCGKIML